MGSTALCRHALVALVALAGASASACGKDSSAPKPVTDPAPVPSQPSSCGHAACGSNFFVDAAPVGDCEPGANCAVALKLVATGEFHINDEYPYKFKADDAPGLQFLGTDRAGKNVFSKDAANWQKRDEKTGVMTVTFQAADPGSKTVAGLFKLSVCSTQSCQLEQQTLSTTVAVRSPGR